LGPKFIFNDPATAARRRTTELATLKRKIELRFFEKRVYPGRPVDQFIAELNLLLQRFHTIPLPLRRSQQNLNNSKEHRFIVEFPIDLVMLDRPLQISTEKKKKNELSSNSQTIKT
jgi:hypothetical protein